MRRVPLRGGVAQTGGRMRHWAEKGQIRPPERSVFPRVLMTPLHPTKCWLYPLLGRIFLRDETNVGTWNSGTHTFHPGLCSLFVLRRMCGADRDRARD